MSLNFTNFLNQKRVAFHMKNNNYKYNKTLESMNKNEVVHSSLIRPIAKLLVPKKSISIVRQSW